MKPYILIILGLLFCLVSLAAYPDPELPVLGGEWVQEDDGSFWYLHSIEEFDADIERCNECHGEGAFYNQIWICESEYSL